MLGCTQLLRDGRIGALNEKQQELLDDLSNNTIRLQRFIGDLLLLGTLEAGKDRLNLEICDLNDQMQEIFNYWAPMARKKSLQYELIPAEGSPLINLDPLKLQHIVSNLIENAIKYTSRGEGRVTVTLTRCFWDRRTGSQSVLPLFPLERRVNKKVENAVRIDVEDNGRGIPPEYQEEIFKEFVRLPDSPAGGTGLGLAIARRLVEAHKGAIWVESAGHGSKFSVLIPHRRQL